MAVRAWRAPQGFPLRMQACICIDPGILNVGVFGIEFDADKPAPIRVTVCSLVDTAAVPRADATNCVRHAHTYASWFVTQLETKHLQTTTQVVVEAQPPGSAGMPLEIVLRERFAPKDLTFFSPASIHTRFELRGLTHDARKAKSLAIARDTLMAWHAAGTVNARSAKMYLDGLPRAHDCADAVLLCVMYMESRKPVPVLPPLHPALLPSCDVDVFAFMRTCMHASYQERAHVPLAQPGKPALPPHPDTPPDAASAMGLGPP